MAYLKSRLSSPLTAKSDSGHYHRSHPSESLLPFERMISNIVDEMLHIAWEKAVRPIPLDEAVRRSFVVFISYILILI